MQGLKLPRKTQILNIRLPEELILELDSLVQKKIFKSRSEAIREFTREYVQENPRIPEEKNAKKTGRGGEG